MPVIDLGRVIGPQGPQGDTGAQGIRGEQGLPGPNQVTNSTATPLTGVLTGNGSVVGVENIDDAPTPNSTGFATSGGTDKAIKGRVPVNGMGKNILDNWFFGNPVNQRGLTTYPSVAYGSRYTIDRWFTNSWYVSVSVNSGNVSVTNNYSSAQSNCFHQNISAKAGMHTLSALLADGSFFSTTGSLVSASVGISLALTNSAQIGAGTDNVWLASGAGETVSFVAIKLEPGTEQTLCHNEGTEENPVWVLNDIPDYEYELYRCMTSTADSSDTYANKSLATEQEIAYVEKGTTASKAYAVNDRFCMGGLLYKVTVAIQSGGAITPGTNCEPDTVGSEITKFDGLIAKTPGVGTRDAQLQVGTYNSVATINIVSKPRDSGKPDVTIDIAVDYIRVYYTDGSGTTTTKTYRPAT